MRFKRLKSRERSNLADPWMVSVPRREPLTLYPPSPAPTMAAYVPALGVRQWDVVTSSQ